MLLPIGVPSSLNYLLATRLPLSSSEDLKSTLPPLCPSPRFRLHLQFKEISPTRYLSQSSCKFVSIGGVGASMGDTDRLVPVCAIDEVDLLLQVWNWISIIRVTFPRKNCVIWYSCWQDMQMSNKSCELCWHRLETEEASSLVRNRDQVRSPTNTGGDAGSNDTKCASGEDTNEDEDPEEEHVTRNRQSRQGRNKRSTPILMMLSIWGESNSCPAKRTCTLSD